ncbi:MAG: hypothetical protein Q8898_15650, partial [Bacillota bacterium]|nr:hypothetical protein [Bacillota bacterium]
MEENQAENVQEPVQQEQTQEEVTSQQAESPQQSHADGSASKQKLQAEINWEQARQALQMQKAEIEELRQRLAQQAQPKVEEEPDEFADMDPSDYVTVEKAQKLAEKKAKIAAKQIVGEYMQQQNLENDQARMRSKHDDYDYVIENYAIPLIKQDPALAHKIQTSRNPAET